LKTTKFFLFYFFILALSTLALILKDLDFSFNEFSFTESYLFIWTVFFAICSTIFYLESVISGNKFEKKIMHQNIGGYIPTKKLDALVSFYVIKKGGTINRLKKNFTTNRKHAEQLKYFFDSCDFEKNIPKQKVTCKVSIDGNQYEAISVSEEMALCIAFLKSCGYKVD